MSLARLVCLAPFAFVLACSTPSESGSDVASVGGGGLPAPTTPCGQMPANTALGPNDFVTSCDGRFALVMQGSDGNLVLYQSGGVALWSANTQGPLQKFAAMQGDGNLVVYRVND